MARILIIGCGCRGQTLARALVAEGHAVRGTTRSGENFPAIAATGAEPYLGDPDRIATLMDGLTGVTIVCWLLGSATGSEEKVHALHGGRLEMLCEKLVDTPVRGLVYEARGSVDANVLVSGTASVRLASERWRIPAGILETSPENPHKWLADALALVSRLLG